MRMEKLEQSVTNVFVYFSVYYITYIKSRIAINRAAFSQKKALFNSKWELYSKKKLVECYIWSTALCGA
jgi:hypothetical protein